MINETAQGPDFYWSLVDWALAALYALAMHFSKPERRDTAGYSLGFAVIIFCAADFMYKFGVDDFLFHVGIFCLYAVWAAKMTKIGTKTVWVGVMAMAVLQLVIAADSLVVMWLDHNGIAVVYDTEIKLAYGYVALSLHLITIGFIWSWPSGRDKISDLFRFIGYGNRGNS